MQMFASRSNLFILTWQRLAFLARRWWLLWVPVAVLILGLAVWASIHLQGARAFHNAQRDFQENRLEDAKLRLDRYLEAWPADAEAHLLAARIDRLMGLYQPAANHLNECKHLLGMTESIQLEWLVLRTMNGDFAVLEKDLANLVLDDYPQAPLVLETLAICYLSGFRYLPTLSCLERWLKKEPNSIRALSLRAFVWEKLEAREKFQKDLQRILELCPQNWHTRIQLVEMLLMEKNTREAAPHLQALGESHGGEPEGVFGPAPPGILLGDTQETRPLPEKLLPQKNKPRPA